MPREHLVHEELSFKGKRRKSLSEIQHGKGNGKMARSLILCATGCQQRRLIDLVDEKTLDLEAKYQ